MVRYADPPTMTAVRRRAPRRRFSHSRRIRDRHGRVSGRRPMAGGPRVGRRAERIRGCIANVSCEYGSSSRDAGYAYICRRASAPVERRQSQRHRCSEAVSLFSRSATVVVAGAGRCSAFCPWQRIAVVAVQQPLPRGCWPSDAAARRTCRSRERAVTVRDDQRRPIERLRLGRP